MNKDITTKMNKDIIARMNKDITARMNKDITTKMNKDIIARIKLKKNEKRIVKVFSKINSSNMSGLDNNSRRLTVGQILEEETDSPIVIQQKQQILDLSRKLNTLTEQTKYLTEQTTRLTETNETLVEQNRQLSRQKDIEESCSSKLKKELEDATKQIETLRLQLDPPLISLPNFSLVPIPLPFYQIPEDILLSQTTDRPLPMPLSIVFYEEGIYEVHGFTSILRTFGFMYGYTTIFGSVSKFGEITLKTPLDKINLGLPSNSVDFCFVYPWSISDNDKIKELIKGGLIDKLKSEIQKRGEDYTYVIDLLFFGGYLYRDENKKNVKLVSLKPGAGLTFDNPIKISPFSVRFNEVLSPDNIIQEQIKNRTYDIMISLFKYGRFQPVTIESLWILGARLFAWLIPNEFPEFNIPYGAFIYINANLENSCLVKVKGQTSKNYTEASFKAVCSDGKWIPPQIASTIANPECQICFVNQPDTVFVPCGHYAVCDSCSKELQKARSPKCPFCRQNIGSAIKCFKVE